MRKSQFALGAIIVALALTAHAQVPFGKKNIPAFPAGVAREAKLKEDTVKKVLEAFAPAIKEQLQAGRSVEIPGVGVFQVVRVTEHKDLVDGLPATIPAKNYIEFVPAPAMNDAANAPGAVPARVVEGYQFRVNPNSAPSSRMDSVRVPRTRTR